MNTLHDDIRINLDWQRIQLSVSDAAEVVTNIENSILDDFATKSAKAVIGLTAEAFRALLSEGFEIDESNYMATIVAVNLPGCNVYVFDRDCFWDKSTGETGHEAWDRMKAAGHEAMCLIDDETSDFVPFFTYGSQHKIIEIEGWIDPPRPVIEWDISIEDEEAPF